MQQTWSKPQNYTEKVPRASHGLDKIFQTTFHQCKNYPAMARKVNAGDKVRVDLRDIVNSDPMLSPLRGMYRLTFASFFCPDTNIYGWKRDNDQLTIEEQLDSSNFTMNLPLRPDSARLRAYDEFGDNLTSIEVIPNLYDTRFGGPCFDAPNIFRNDVGNSQKLKEATEVLIANNNLSGVGRGSLLDFLGFAPGFQGVMPATGEMYSTTESAVFKADPIIHYLDIMRSCYTNTQTDGENLAVGSGSFIPYQSNIHDSVNSGQVGERYNRDSFYTNLSLTELDGFFKWLRTKDSNGFFFDFNRLYYAVKSSYLGNHTDESSTANYFSFAYYMENNINPFSIDSSLTTSLNTVDLHWLFFFCRFVWTALRPHCGLFSAQYRPDVYRNLLKFGDNVASEVNTSNGVITIDTVRYANRWQQIIERFDVSDGRFTTAMRTLNGIKVRQDLTVPQMLGAVTHMIDPQTITALAQTGEIGAPGSTDVGQMSSNVDSFSKHRRISFYADTPGYFFVIFQLVPLVSYCQGIDPELRAKKFSDDFNSQLTNLGFEAVPISTYSSLPTTFNQRLGELENIPVISRNWLDSSNQPLNEVLGRNILWSRYMSSVNSCHGEYSTCGSRDYWVNQRRFTRYYSEEVEGLNPSGNSFLFFPYGVFADAASVPIVPPNSAVVLSAETVISPYADFMDFQYHFKDQDPYSAHWYLDLMIDYQVTSQVPKTYMGQLERY